MIKTINPQDEIFWLAIFFASLSIVWGLVIDFIGGKVWLLGYWPMLIAWIFAIVKSKQKSKWGIWPWAVQVCMCLFGFILKIDRAVTFTLWSINGFAP